MRRYIEEDYDDIERCQDWKRKFHQGSFMPFQKDAFKETEMRQELADEERQAKEWERMQ